MKKVLWVFVLIFSMVHSFAEMEFPKPEGFVNDFAGVLRGQEKAEIARIAENLEKDTTAEIAVVTVKTVKPYSIEEYSVKLFEKWGIGKAGKDNGTLLLVAVEDREVKIEVGYGLEGVLPDGLCGEIIRTAIIPEFKRGNYGAGIVRGTEAIAGIISGKSDYKTEKPAKDAVADTIATIIVFLIKRLFAFIILILFIIGLFSKSSKKGYNRNRARWSSGTSSWGSSSSWGGFSGGSSFGGFGGGASGGGGAVGRW